MEGRNNKNMKKETLIEIILGTVGGLVFAFGMCMALIEEWNLLVPGIITGIIGAIILLCIFPVYRKSHPKKEHKPIDKGLLATWIIGIVGSLVMGFGMSRVLVDGENGLDILGMICGIIGLIICVLNYPIYSYLKDNK